MPIPDEKNIRRQWRKFNFPTSQYYKLQRKFLDIQIIVAVVTAAVLTLKKRYIVWAQSTRH